MSIFGQGSFTIDQDTTPEMLRKKREQLMAMMPQYGKARYVGEGLGQLAYGIGSGIKNRKMDKYEGERSKEATDQYNAALSGYSPSAGPLSVLGMAPGGTWTPDAPPPSPTDVPQASGGLSFGMGQPDMPQEGSGGLAFTPPPMTPQQMIIAGAEARGLDPIDVATAISYETGGTFDPVKGGPTTQWGQHRGLIQFGEPQAQQYGADFSSPDAAMKSQLDPETGAVWGYLDGTGVKPGMGLDNIYSAINAGAPGRFNASDANNGGAPGTVADKVAGMGDHRKKAAEFLGGTWTPAEASAPGMTVSTRGGPQPGGAGPDLQSLIAAASNPWLTPEQRGMINGLIQQQQGRDNAVWQQQLAQSDPMYQAQLAEAQRAAQPQAPKPIEVGGVLLDPTTYQTIFDSRTPDPGYTMVSPAEVEQMGLPPGAYQRGADGKISEIGGGGVNVTVGGGPELGKLSTDFGYVLDANGKPVIDPATGLPKAAPVPGSPAAIEAETKKNAAGNKAGNARTATETVTTAAARAREAAGKREWGGFGSSIIGGVNPYSDSAEVIRQVDVMKSNAKIGNLQAMRDASPTGGALGAVTAPELQMLADKSGALDPQSPNFLRDLDDYERTLLRTIHGPEVGDQIYTETRGNASDADGWQTINGVKIRVKK